MIEKLKDLENNSGFMALDFAIEYRDDFMFEKLSNERSNQW